MMMESLSSFRTGWLVLNYHHHISHDSHTPSSSSSSTTTIFTYIRLCASLTVGCKWSFGRDSPYTAHHQPSFSMLPNHWSIEVLLRCKVIFIPNHATGSAECKQRNTDTVHTFTSNVFVWQWPTGFVDYKSQSVRQHLHQVSLMTTPSMEVTVTSTLSSCTTTTFTVVDKPSLDILIFFFPNKWCDQHWWNDNNCYWCYYYLQLTFCHTCCYYKKFKPLKIAAWMKYAMF
jgi:hypothetical protein